MENVWTHGELSASEVGKILSAKRRLAQNTVWTLLLRMEEKGWLMPREEGRTHRYRAAVPRETSIGKKVVELVLPTAGFFRRCLLCAAQPVYSRNSLACKQACACFAMFMSLLQSDLRQFRQKKKWPYPDSGGLFWRLQVSFLPPQKSQKSVQKLASPKASCFAVEPEALGVFAGDFGNGFGWDRQLAVEEQMQVGEVIFFGADDRVVRAPEETLRSEMGE